MNEEEKQIFGGRKTNKFILILSFIVLIISIVLLLAGKWFFGIGGIVLHIIIAYISYRLSGGKHNKIIWKEMDLFELIKKTYQSGEMKIGFHTMRDQEQLLEKLKIDGLITSFPGNVRDFLRDGLTTKREVFVALQDFIIIESIHDGREWFWDGYGKIVSRKFFHAAEILINIDSSVISRFFHVLKGIMSENNDVSLKMKEGALRITWQRTLSDNEREIEHHYVSDVGSVFKKSNELAELDHKKGIAKSGMTVLEILKNGHWVEWRSEKGLNIDELTRKIRYKLMGGSDPGFLDENLKKQYENQQVYCPSCGTKGVQGLSKCFQCHKSLKELGEESEYRCHECGVDVSRDAKYCWNCGEPYKEENTEGEDGIKMDEKVEKTFGKSIKYCPYCGKTDIRENEICFECGRYLHKVRCESKYKCTKCSCNVPKDAQYCWNCGEKFAEDEVSSAEKCSMEEKGHSAAMCLLEWFGKVPLYQSILDSYNKSMKKTFRLRKPFTPDAEDGIRMQFEITCFIAFLTIREFTACQLPPRPRSATTTTPNQDELNSFIIGFLGTIVAFFVQLNYPEVKEVLIDEPGPDGFTVRYGESLDLRRRVESYMRLSDVKMCCDYFAELLTAVFSRRERHIGAFATSKIIVALVFYERFVEVARLVLKKTVLNTDSQQ